MHWGARQKHLSTAHEVSDDSSVCFWLVSMVNVSTTDTLFEEAAAAASADVKMCSMTASHCREPILWPRRSWKKKHSFLQPFIVLLPCFLIYLQAWCDQHCLVLCVFDAQFSNGWQIYKAYETLGCLILITLELYKSFSALFLWTRFDKVLPGKSILVCMSQTGLRRKHYLKKKKKKKLRQIM